jgi:uncharacterized membrane protein
MDAVRASFRTTSSNVGQLLPFAIVVFLVYIVGAIACGVGLLVSAPVALLAITYAFRRLHGQSVAA